uniref:hypothetical protein n=1 Tax=Pachymeniopsis lanceolata TaxID=151733 RepID=UPI002A836E32|nr:hypothetical protein UYL67_pgp158 [Pachymeniopsis lanceolata]WOL37180.1 hypothetical protein [Pachymeniopsis lanceolata]
MSHFSRIKTSISELTILHKTLEDLGFECLSKQCSVEDSYGNLQNVDLLVRSESENILGFAWDGSEYNLVADLHFWNQSMSVERFVDKVKQTYALNSVLQESVNEGFNQVGQEVARDGSIKLVIQRWY